MIIENTIKLSVSHKYKAYMAMISYIWVFNLQYPKKGESIFEFIQKVLLGLDNQSISVCISVALKHIKKVFN